MKNLFWIDMEMTGLNPQQDRILEVALIVTNEKFETLTTYEEIIYQDKNIVDNMNDWCKKHHAQSGLSAKISSGKMEAQVEEDLLQIVKQYSPKDKSILAGNSIGQDRKFIDIWMPKLAETLHYRMLDVSSFKIIFEEIYKKKFKKEKKHRAVDDILESIAELKYYMEFIRT